MVKFVDFLHLRPNKMIFAINLKNSSARLDFDLFPAFLLHKLATTVIQKSIPALVQQDFVLG
jgi:hypothetical protein